MLMLLIWGVLKKKSGMDTRHVGGIVAKILNVLLAINREPFETTTAIQCTKDNLARTDKPIYDSNKFEIEKYYSTDIIHPNAADNI